MRSIVGVAFGLASVACVLPNDGFRTKLAGGCNSQEACIVLYEKAEKRWEACMSASRTGRGCNEQLQDKFSASDMKNRQQEADEKARRDAVEREYAERSRQGTERQASTAETARTHVSDECAADRDARIAAIRAALRAAHEVQQENRRREAYVKAHCRLVHTPLYENQMRADPGTGIVRVVPVQVNTWESTKCPAGTPAGLVDTDGALVTVTVPADVRKGARSAMERSVHCHDLDANNPDAPEFAGAMSDSPLATSPESQSARSGQQPP
jgi:hypothetical protein